MAVNLPTAHSIHYLLSFPIFRSLMRWLQPVAMLDDCGLDGSYIPFTLLKNVFCNMPYFLPHGVLVKKTNRLSWCIQLRSEMRWVYGLFPSTVVSPPPVASPPSSQLRLILYLVRLIWPYSDSLLFFSCSPRRHCTWIFNLHPTGWYDLSEVGGAFGAQWSDHTVWGIYKALLFISHCKWKHLSWKSK